MHRVTGNSKLGRQLQSATSTAKYQRYQSAVTLLADIETAEWNARVEAKKQAKKEAKILARLQRNDTARLV